MRNLTLKKVVFYVVICMVNVSCNSNSTVVDRPSQQNDEDKPKSVLTIDKLQQDTFNYFWETTDPETGLAPDRYPSDSPASIAAIGFALTSYGVGVERGYIQRDEAIERTLSTLRTLWKLPMGPAAKGTAGYKGFYYHFLNMHDGTRYTNWQVELSTVDTALMVAGILFAQSYFDQDNESEKEIRELADLIYLRVDWQWAQNKHPLISLGWYPEKGFINYDWVGYNEAMLVYLLGLGSPTHPIEKNAWDAWVDHYEDDWGGEHLPHLTFAPMFGHQYSHVWFDFREIQDDYMRQKQSDYFVNSQKAVLAQREYAIANPSKWSGYSENIWGITASDGPGDVKMPHGDSTREFRAYSARGVALNHSFDDGTLAPTALGGSLPFAPEIIIPTLQNIYNQYGQYLYGEYGFLDAFNLSYTYPEAPGGGRVVPGVGWFGTDYIGIDQGPILIMAENLRSELVWKTMKKNKYFNTGLLKAGFTGGYLNHVGHTQPSVELPVNQE